MTYTQNICYMKTIGELRYMYCLIEVSEVIISPVGTFYITGYPKNLNQFSALPIYLSGGTNGSVRHIKSFQYYSGGSMIARSLTLRKTKFLYLEETSLCPVDDPTYHEVSLKVGKQGDNASADERASIQFWGIATPNFS